MATEIYISRHPNLPFLQAAYPEDQELLKGLRHGEVYRADIVLPRNVKFHKKFFALINLVFESLPEGFCFDTPDGHTIEIRSREDLLWHIKMQVGHYEQKMTLGGKMIYEAKSISFAKMDESEFSAFYDKAIDVILKYFLVGTDREELIEIVAVEF